MPIIVRYVRLLALIVSFALNAALDSVAAPAKPTPVEFRYVGDDVLSERLADQIESAFKQSPDFTLTVGRKPGTLIVRIPENVEPRGNGQRGQVFFTVDFSTTEGRELGVRKGSCSKDDLAKCAAKVVRDASVVARRMH